MNAPAALGGMTRFLRCAACHTLYEAAIGLQVTTGAIKPYWTRPTARRGTRTKTIFEEPIPCDHRGAIEQWDGQQWISAPLKETTS